MTWFPDFSQYSYLPESVPVGQLILNIGWLDSEHDFSAGDPPADFIDALAELCRKTAHARTRGWHACNLAHTEELEYPCVIKASGHEVALGSAEIRVTSKSGTKLSAPNLVWHYVDYHRYLPPDEFIEAVLAHRKAELQGRKLKAGA